MHKTCLAILLNLVFFNQIQSKSVSEATSYPEVCLQAAENDEYFLNFKRHPLYVIILEHLTYEQGEQYLQVIQSEYPEILEGCDKFRENDLLGNPKIFDYGDIGFFSPTTLRYMKVAAELRKRFGPQLQQMNIVEIGGGYGGQCKVLADLYGFGSYTIIDLAQSNALSKKYLNLLGVTNVHFISNTELDLAGKYDLVISNYAFSELETHEQIQYWEKVIKPTSHGYFTLNFVTNKSFAHFSLPEILYRLKKASRTPITESENPLTDWDNILLTW